MIWTYSWHYCVPVRNVEPSGDPQERHRPVRGKAWSPGEKKWDPD